MLKKFLQVWKLFLPLQSRLKQSGIFYGLLGSKNRVLWKYWERFTRGKAKDRVSLIIKRICDAFFSSSRKANVEERSNLCVVSTAGGAWRRDWGKGAQKTEFSDYNFNRQEHKNYCVIHTYIQRKKIRANGGCLGYPEAMKDVVSCDKARGSANRNWSEHFWMGEPNRLKTYYSREWERTRGTETS